MVRPTLLLLSMLGQPCVALPVRYQGDVPLPDFERITFANLPALAEGGSLDLSRDLSAATFGLVRHELGYDPSRTWQAGDGAGEAIMLGDVSAVFGLEHFSLEQIGALQLGGRLVLSDLKLADLKMLAHNTVAQIVEALDYADLPVADVPLLADLADLAGLGPTFSARIGDLLSQFPEFAALPLGTADLTHYALSGLPGIESVAIERLSGWAAQFITDIPGLENVSFASFLRLPATWTGIASRVDIPLAKVERNRRRTVSGSDVEGFAVPCSQECLHIELGDPLRGKQWIGRSQQVRGGHGILAVVNGGREPTGRLPFGAWGKVVLTAVNEKAGSADFGLYLRVCLQALGIDLGCTPYFIGPIPWIGSREKDFTFLGP